MVVQSDWYSERKEIILLRFVGKWTSDEVDVAHQNWQSLVKNTGTRFDIISDLSQAAYTPPIGTLWEWKKGAELREVVFPNWGLTVFVFDSDVYKAYYEEGLKSSSIIRWHYRLAKTLDEAIQIIQSERLPEVK